MSTKFFMTHILSNPISTSNGRASAAVGQGLFWLWRNPDFVRRLLHALVRYSVTNLLQRLQPSLRRQPWQIACQKHKMEPPTKKSCQKLHHSLSSERATSAKSMWTSEPEPRESPRLRRGLILPTANDQNSSKPSHKLHTQLFQNTIFFHGWTTRWYLTTK